jgi:hypothetical protein
MFARFKLFLGVVAGLSFGIAIQAHAQEVKPDGTDLFTTVSDFNQWSHSGDTNIGTPNYDWDLSTINGLGNTTAAGAADTPGALLIQLGNPTNNYQFPAFSPGEQNNQGFLSALDPGAVAGSSLAQYSGTLTMTYSIPATTAGTYYELGVVLNYDGNFGQYFPASTTSGGVVDGQPTTVASIPYTVNATSMSYFQLGIIYNSDYAPTGPIYVDDIEVPEPASIGMLGAGVAMLTLRRRKSSV